VKTGPGKAEPEGCGGSTVEGNKAVWPDFRRNPDRPSLNPAGLGKNAGEDEGETVAGLKAGNPVY
jgi:hypothetical protein